MEKDMMKKKFGLPPMPPIVTGGQTKRNFMRKKDYSPVHWDKYFETKLDVTTDSGDTFRVYEKGQDGPVLLFLHGGGFSALSWALLTAQVTTMVKCRCVAIDLRGHGDTMTSDDSNLSAEQMSSDVGTVVSSLYKDDPPPIVLVGHSMGGAIAVHTAVRNLISTLIGLAVIDVVEGTALEALSSMQSFLRGRPKTFDTMDRAIEWAVRSGQIQNLESARVSMVGQLKSTTTEETGSEELEHQHHSFTDVIEEEPGEDGLTQIPATSSSADSFKSQERSNDGHKYTWRIDLSKTEKFWKGWFEGLSQKFLSCEPPKILILAGPDRLDKDLTIGQMQGQPVRKAARTKTEALKRKAASNAERVQSWRERVKKDPEAYAAYLLREKERVRAYCEAQKLKMKMEEEIEHARRLARARQQLYIQKQKQTEKTPTRQTRLDRKRSDDMRQYNRLAQQRCRSSWNPQKRAKVNAKERQKYLEKKADLVEKATPRSVPSQPEMGSPPYSNQESHKRAGRRVRAKIKEKGKFQINLLPQCGHAVHEDVPDKVADILANFMLRHQVTEAIGEFHRSIPGC